MNEDEKLEQVETPAETPAEQTTATAPQSDLSAVLEAIADLKQVITTALTQIEPNTVVTDPEPEPEPQNEAPEQDLNEIAQKLGF